MRNKIITICILIILFVFFVLINTKTEICPEYKVLKVIEADKFYIDLNKNSKIDDNELFKLKDIIAFSPIKNSYTISQAEKLKIPIEQYLKVGFLSQYWAKDNLEGKYVKITSSLNDFDIDKKLRFVKIDFKNSDLGTFLLKNGLAHVYQNCKTDTYFQFQNLKQVKANYNELSSIDFLFLNLKTNVLHKLSCEHFKTILNGKLISPKEKNNYKNCKVCFSNTTIKYNIATNKRIDKKSRYIKKDNIELFLLNPYEFDKPQNSCRTTLCKRLLKEINSARYSIDMATYGMGEQSEIIQALKNAKLRGVKIRSVCDKSTNIDKIYPKTALFVKEFNSVTDSDKIIMHNKFFIFDNKKVLTGSTNISTSGTGGYNANLALIITSNELANIYKSEFEQMYNGNFSKNKIPSSKQKVCINNTELKVYFSPNDSIYGNCISDMIKNAKTEICISAFYLTDKSLIAELINAKNKGVKVYILLDAVGAYNFQSRIKLLKDNGIPVKTENWGGKNHEKTILVDSEILLTGSCNFSSSGFYKNDENMIAIKNKDIAEFYRKYFFMLFNSIDNKYLKFIPRAESYNSINSCYDGIDNNFDGKIDMEDDGCKAKH